MPLCIKDSIAFNATTCTLPCLWPHPACQTYNESISAFCQSYCLSCLEPPRCTATAECLPTTRLRMIARVTSDWKDPHNGGTYSVLSKADGELNLQRVTGCSDLNSGLLPLKPPLMRYKNNKIYNKSSTEATITTQVV